MLIISNLAKTLNTEKKINQKDQERTMTILPTNERVILWPLDKERDNLKSICSRFVFFNNSLVIHMH